MFLGMQNDLIAMAAKTKKELEQNKFIKFTEIKETEEPVELILGTYYVGETSILEAKQTAVRSVRDSYLKEYIDSVVSNPLRWSDMSEQEVKLYTYYRKYLLDYTTRENWWEQNPITLEEFKE